VSDSRNGPTTLTAETLNTPFAEAYRTLRANINFSGIDAPVRTLVVTSAAPAEGKTTTVVNLGIIMAQAGHSVVLVDADFRRPSLHHCLGVNGQADGADGGKYLGLSNVIVGATSLQSVVTETGFPNLHLLPAGVIPPNPGELLSSHRMGALVEELSQLADYVLVDSPPCRLYADGLMLAALTDGVIYVLRSGNQDKAAQRRVQKQIKQSKARLLGVVFNDVEVEDAAAAYGYYNGNGHHRRR
jgi:capsular exopolysaccharide synthesis family protein